MFKGLYDALPNLADTQALIANTVAAVPDVVATTHRQLHRYLPEWHDTLHDTAGYKDALLQNKGIAHYRHLVETCKVAPRYNQYGYNALSAVAESGPDQTKCIEFLLCYDINMNSPSHLNRLRTPLHLMIAHKNTELTLFFIHYTRNHGKVINFQLRDNKGHTPLLLAIKMMQKDIALCIIEQSKYSVEVAVNQVDHKGKTALDYAFILGQPEVTNALLGIGAKFGVVHDDLSNLDLYGLWHIREILNEVLYEPYDRKPEDYQYVDRRPIEDECVRKQLILRDIFSPPKKADNPGRREKPFTSKGSGVHINFR